MNYTTEQISAKYETLSYKKKCEILEGALSYMEQYNGRSQFTCIAMAMGYENYEGGRDTFTKRSEK